MEMERGHHPQIKQQIQQRSPYFHLSVFNCISISSFEVPKAV